MYYKVPYNYNLEKKKINFVSYIITTYNKKNFVNDVIKSLCFEGGSHKREYIVIDDGSKDNSSFVYKTLSKKLAVWKKAQTQNIKLKPK